MATRSDTPSGADIWLRRMRAWGVKPSRSKGQNFLLDSEVVSRIADAARIRQGDTVLEVGPGLGILTEELLGRGGNVTAVELDDTLADRLANHFRHEPHFRLIHDDATRVDPALLFPDTDAYRIVANLPYGVATVIVRHFLESDRPPTEMIVMVQREVAERMTATAGDLSLLTLAIQLYTEPHYLFTVPKDAFHPEPKVTSAVVRLVTRESHVLDVKHRERLFQLATLAFQQKRKTLLNTLSRGLGLEKTLLENKLREIGIDGSQRPQALSFEQWLRLASEDLVER